MSTVTIQVGGVEEFMERLNIVGDSISEWFAAANTIIEGETRAAIEELYPGGLAAQWVVTSEVGVAGGQLASVTAASSNQMVLWYEFGTRPHAIDPVNADALAFVPRWSSQVEYFVHVDHPGEAAREHGPELLERMAASAAMAWAEAIDEFIASL